jgi:hypothetical protein
VPAADDQLVREAVAKARRKGFDSLVLLVAWSIWHERNCSKSECATASIVIAEGIWGRCEL